MSTFVHIDTLHRDREYYPNPASFELGTNKLEGWSKAARTVSRIPADPKNRPLEFVTTVEIEDFTIPYEIKPDDVEGPEIYAVNFPRLYLDIHSKSLDDKYLVNTISGTNNTMRFVLTFDKVQNDDLGNPVWTHWNCSMTQTLRIKRDDVFVFNLFSRSGVILPIADAPLDAPESEVALRQILATFSLTPYFRDDKYDNHMVEPVNAL